MANKDLNRLKLVFGGAKEDCKADKAPIYIRVE